MKIILGMVLALILVWFLIKANCIETGAGVYGDETYQYACKGKLF